MANSFGTTNTNPNEERLWFQNPVQTLSPEVIRPFSFSQVPSRSGIFEDENNTPQQTAGSAGVTMDLSSKFSNETNINEAYNFDVQQNNTAFVFNMNNTNNMVEVSYATQNLINNNNYSIEFQGGNNVVPSGISATIVSYSNMVWSDFENEDSETNFQLSFTVTTSTYENGLLVDVVEDEQQEFVTFTALDTLYLWYLAGVDNPAYIIGTDVSINTTSSPNKLEQQYRELYLDHGLIIDTNNITPIGVISTLTDCDP